MTKFLIINADDYGWDIDINNACHALAAAGSLTSVSAMAGSIESLDNCRFQVNDGAQVSVGVHLNLSTGRPVNLGTRSSPLVDSNTGNFRNINLNNLSSLFLSFEKKSIAKEFDAQIETVLSMAGSITHLDTHHHVARLPTIAIEVAEAALRHGIARVRTPKGFSVKSLPPHRRFVVGLNERIYKSRKLRFPSVRFGMPKVESWEGFERQFRRYASDDTWPEGSIAELSCHPSVGAGVLNQSPEMKKRRHSDFTKLSDERFVNLLFELNIVRISYYDL